MSAVTRFRVFDSPTVVVDAPMVGMELKIVALLVKVEVAKVWNVS